MRKIYGVTFDNGGSNPMEKYHTLLAPNMKKAVEYAERYKSKKYYSWYRIVKIVEILSVDIHYK